MRQPERLTQPGPHLLEEMFRAVEPGSPQETIQGKLRRAFDECSQESGRTLAERVAAWTAFQAYLWKNAGEVLEAVTVTDLAVLMAP